jgi:hypothetical protein
MRKPKKKYPLTAFQLWKRDHKGKWHHYNQIFDYSDVTTYDYMNACKMMVRGWIPYSMIMTPGGEPLQLEMVDYAPLEEMLRETDPIGVIAGDAIREFIQKTPVDARRKFTPESVTKIALAIAQDAKQNGQFVPKHLLKLLGDNNV